MKKLLLMICLGVFLLPGCKYFKRSARKMVDTAIADTSMKAIAKSDSTTYLPEGNPSAQAETLAPQKAKSVPSGKYYMIVGCFKMQQHVDNMTAKLKGMGYDPTVLPGPNSLQMVAAQSYSSYREGIAEIDKFRTQVDQNAWVYRKR
jgi:hypothetical protein